MDDLEFAATSRAEAEDVLMTWDSLLNALDLTINPRKTEIVEGPIPPEAAWRVSISQFRIREESDMVLAYDLRGLFSMAIELSRLHPGEPVISYALQRMRPRPRGQQAWDVFSDILLASAVAEPSSLAYVWDALRWAHKQDIQLDLDSIAQTMNEMCLHHAPLEHGSEVAWSMYVLRELGLSLGEAAAARVASMRDNCALIILLEFVARGRTQGAPPNIADVISRAEDPLAVRNEDWLLGYESARLGWSDPRHFNGQANWAQLLRLDVPFFAVKGGGSQPSAPPSPPSRTTGEGQVPNSEDRTEPVSTGNVALPGPGESSGYEHEIAAGEELPRTLEEAKPPSADDGAQDYADEDEDDEDEDDEDEDDEDEDDEDDEDEDEVYGVAQGFFDRY